MNEVLFVHSPITLVLSLISLVLAASFPAMIGQKVKTKVLPKPLFQLVLILIIWNIISIIGTAFFSGNNPGLPGQILFTIQAVAWVQVGNAIYHLCETNLNLRRHNLWRLLNAFGVAFVIASSVFIYKNPDAIPNHPYFTLYTVAFGIFVLPELIITIYLLLKSAMQTNDKNLSQMSMYMLLTLTAFVTIPTLFDFVLPIAYSFNMNGVPPHFMLWFQFSCLFLTVLCGQYYTSISFKNKSSHWFLEKLIAQLGDIVMYYESNGNILSANPAAQTLLQATEEELKRQKIQNFFPDIDFSKETLQSNVKVKIKQEEHHFNLAIYKVRMSLTSHTNILLLSDQSSSLFYRKRIKSLNKQFVEYKQDLLKFQHRLDANQKSFEENSGFLVTLINALPFQFWSKNENGVYKTQNQKDLEKRGNLIHTIDPSSNISNYETKAKEEGVSSSFDSYVDANGNEISEDEALVQINAGENISIYENLFIPIISDKPPYKTIGIRIDLTEQKKLERERNMLQEQKNIHSRLEELGTLCGAFAHDYNNILGSQIGFCQLAQEMVEAAQKKEDTSDIQKTLGVVGSFIGEATKAAQRGKVSLEELLNTIRGKTNAAPEAITFFPYMIIDDVKKKLALTLPPSISISSEKMDKTLRISGVPASLDRIISNLSNNAIFAMKETGGTLTLALEQVVLEQQLISPYAPPIPAGTYAKFTIGDTGSGMDSGTLERIFSPFFTTKAPGEGLGLGLSSALRLLKEGNAYFTVQTTLGEGTIFNLYWSMNNDAKEEIHGNSSDN